MTETDEKKELEKILEEQQIYCNSCKRNTRHKCIWKIFREDSDYDEELGVPNSIEYYIYIVWCCQGCNEISFEERYSHLEILNDKGDIVWYSTFYPIRKKGFIQFKYFKNLPEKLNNIYKESLICFNTDARLLCSVGLRSLIEGICKNKKITGKFLENKIDGLASILPQNIVTNLHSLRFMGNDAIHDLSSPSIHELKLAIEICEDLLNYLYELDYKTSMLDKIRKSKV